MNPGRLGLVLGVGILLPLGRGDLGTNVKLVAREFVAGHGAIHLVEDFADIVAVTVRDPENAAGGVAKRLVVRLEAAAGTDELCAVCHAWFAGDLHSQPVLLSAHILQRHARARVEIPPFQRLDQRLRSQASGPDHHPTAAGVGLLQSELVGKTMGRQNYGAGYLFLFTRLNPLRLGVLSEAGVRLNY